MPPIAFNAYEGFFNRLLNQPLHKYRTNSVSNFVSVNHNQIKRVCAVIPPVPLRSRYGTLDKLIIWVNNSFLGVGIAVKISFA